MEVITIQDVEETTYIELDSGDVVKIVEVELEIV